MSNACQAHCCVVHGCKYGHEQCPVVVGQTPQKHLCLDCAVLLREGPELIRRLERVRTLRNEINSRRIQRSASTHTLPVVGQYTVPEVLDHVGRGDREYEGWVVNMGSQRYKLFQAKGVCCATCGLNGSVFLLQREKNPTATTTIRNRAHFNLYGEKDGVLVLFTKDHILAKANGGKNRLSNYQTMCQPCNTEKADRKS